MRPIKFRGRVPACDAIDGGKLVYGSLVEYRSGREKFWINPIDGERNYPVDPDSIAQLVGYDANGREVYEGDTLIAADNIEWTAELVHAPVSADSFQHIIAPEEFTLKEAQSWTTE